MNFELLQRLDADKAVGPPEGVETRILTGNSECGRTTRLNADIRAHAVDHEVVGAFALPVDAELAELIGIGHGRNDPRRQSDQRLKAPPIERQAVD